MKPKHLIACAATLAFSLSPAFAKDKGSAGFLTKAMEGNYAEVSMGDLAQKNGQSDGHEYFPAEIQRGNEQRCQDRACDGAQQRCQLFRGAAGVNFSGDQAHDGRLGNGSGDEKVPPRPNGP